MAKGYWIVRVDITDMEQYKKYVAANAAPPASWCAPGRLKILKARAAPATP